MGKSKGPISKVNGGDNKALDRLIDYNNNKMVQSKINSDWIHTDSNRRPTFLAFCLIPGWQPVAMIALLSSPLGEEGGQVRVEFMTPR